MSPSWYTHRSGSAANLEIALQIINNGIAVFNRVLFAFWSAEEMGLLGSTYFVSTMSEEERSEIALNLNFDMIVSNFYTGQFAVVLAFNYNRGLPITPDRSTMDQE